MLTVCRHYSASFAFRGDPMFTHEPSYSLARTMDSLLFEFGMNARTPVHLAMREKDLPDLGNNESIFSFALAGWALAPCIIATFRDTEYPAHGHNGKPLLVLFNKLIFHLDSREKMLTTFIEVGGQRVLSTSKRVVITFPTAPSRTWTCSFHCIRLSREKAPPVLGYCGIHRTRWVLSSFPCIPSPCIGHYSDHLSTMDALSP